MEVGKLLRLRGAIRSLLDVNPPGHGSAGAGAMIAAYKRIREQVLEVIPEEYHAEFEKLFPRTATAAGGSLLGVLISSEASDYSSARSLLGTLAGWMDGLVDEARMAMEAEAYARARVREDRGVGFRQPLKS